MIKLFVGLVAVCVYAVSGPLRLTSGILLWMLSPMLSLALSLFPHRALRSPTELKDGHDYLFGRRGNRVQRRFFTDPFRAEAHPQGAFTLALDDGTRIPGIRCWQKHYPDGKSCGLGVRSWTNLDCLFGPRRNKWDTRIRRA